MTVTIKSGHMERVTVSSGDSWLTIEAREGDTRATVKGTVFISNAKREGTNFGSLKREEIRAAGEALLSMADRMAEEDVGIVPW